MSCLNCEKVQDSGDIAYIRVGIGNVGIIGCDIHAGKVIRSVNGVYKLEEILHIEREIVRVKGSKKY